MLIWKGHGILILVFGVIGAIVSGLVMAALAAATQWNWLGRLIFPANCWGAAIAIWLYAKTIGKTVSKTYLDPATHRPVVIKRSHSLFFIRPMLWAIMAILGASMMTVVALVMPAGNFMDDASAGGSSPAKAAFQAANRLIEMDKGTESFGNTPEAEKLAQAFSMMVEMGRELGVEKAKKKSFVSLSHGKFLTYCRINPDSCAFMVHVPDLRKFTTGAKKFMVGMAWAMARQQAAELWPQPRRVAVGVRGAFVYDTVVEGSVMNAKTQSAEQSKQDDDEEEGEEEMEAGIEQRHSGFSPEKFLETYFEPHPADAVLPVIGGQGGAMAQVVTAAGGKGRAASPAAGAPLSPMQELTRRVEKFAAQEAGQAEGNSPAAKELAAAYAEAVWANIPFPRAIGETVPHFSAYVHLRHDTAAFMLGLPGEGQMPPGGAHRTRPVAWGLAALAAKQMTPQPVRIVLIVFNDGQMDVASIGVRQVMPGFRPRVGPGPVSFNSTWQVEQEIDGAYRKELLLPFFGPLSGEIITLNTPLKFSPEDIMMPGGTPMGQMQAPPRSSAAGATRSRGTGAKPVPSPLPTPVRDWKDATGRVMQASLESFTTPAKDTGRFKRSDGQAFDVPFSRLSAEDQKFIRGLAAP